MTIDHDTIYRGAMHFHSQDRAVAIRVFYGTCTNGERGWCIDALDAGGISSEGEWSESALADDTGRVKPMTRDEAIGRVADFASYARMTCTAVRVCDPNTSVLVAEGTFVPETRPAQIAWEYDHRNHTNERESTMTTTEPTTTNDTDDATGPDGECASHNGSLDLQTMQAFGHEAITELPVHITCIRCANRVAAAYSNMTQSLMHVVDNGAGEWVPFDAGHKVQLYGSAPEYFMRVISELAAVATDLRKQLTMRTDERDAVADSLQQAQERESGIDQDRIDQAVRSAVAIERNRIMASVVESVVNFNKGCVDGKKEFLAELGYDWPRQEATVTITVSMDRMPDDAEDDGNMSYLVNELERRFGDYAPGSISFRNIDWDSE